MNHFKESKELTVVNSSVLKTRFSSNELSNLKKRFDKNSTQILMPDNHRRKNGKDLAKTEEKIQYKKFIATKRKTGPDYIHAMAIEGFRKCMGVLGLESNAFLSDRIFQVVDTDRDRYITFE